MTRKCKGKRSGREGEDFVCVWCYAFQDKESREQAKLAVCLSGVVRVQDKEAR